MYVLARSRRSYAVAVENVRAQAAVMRKVEAVAPSSGGVVVEKKESFWMRDPSTGNWIPESHFGDVDVAEQREKLLPNKNHNKL